MNKVVLYGRLTKDVEMRYTQSAEAMAVGRFTVAVNRPKKANGEQEADFINCVAFGKTAENISKFFRKGNRILLTGRIQVSNYTDTNGQKRYTTDIIVEGFDFIETKAEKGNNTANANDFYTVENNVENDDLPF